MTLDKAGADKPKKRGPRPIVCLETGQVYPSVKAAAKAMGVTYGGGNLSQAALHGGLFKGYHWYYEGDPKPQPGDLKGNKAVTCLETGEDFESAAAAAEWANTTVDAVYASVRLHSAAGGYQFRLKGSNIGEYTGQHGRPGGRRKRPVVCYETGEVYESAEAAAVAVGRKNASTIYTAIKTGGMSGGFHWYWEGDPKPDASQLLQPKVKTEKQVVCWETDKVFPSLKDAAEAAGLKNVSSIRNAIKKKSAAGGYHWYWEGDPKPDAGQLKRAKSAEKMQVRSVVCWETSEVYPSLMKACEAAGIKDTHRITIAIKNQTKAGGYHWYWEGEPRPDASEFKSPGNRPVVCYETGEVYPSVHKAAAALGIDSSSNIRTATKSHGTVGGYHWYFADEPRPSEEQLKHGRKRPVVCWETGVEYESAAAAARAVNVPPTNVSSACKGGLAGGYHWYYADQPKPKPGDLKGNKAVVCYETEQIFDSAQEAADWAGTTVDGIYMSLRTKTPIGGYHWYLQEKGKPEQASLKSGKPVVCWETGEVFLTARKAAEFAGLKDSSSIHQAISVRANGQYRSAGGYHWYYEGDPKPVISTPAPKEKPKPRPKKNPAPKQKPADTPAASKRRTKDSNQFPVSKSAGPGRRPKPVVCAEPGVTYASATEAAAAVGIKSPRNISIAARTGGTSGGLHWHYEEDGPKEKKRKPRAVVCWETDEVFPSEEAAAEWAGTTAETIDTVMRTHRVAGGYHWYLASKPKPDASELAGRRGVVCLETGEVFSGAQAAADAVGVSIYTIYAVLRGSNHAAGGYHWYWEGDPKPDASQFKPKKNHPVRCIESGAVYESVAAAARAVGTKSNSSISRAARKGYSAFGYHWEYVEN